jgi:hypothetical protein
MCRTISAVTSRNVLASTSLRELYERNMIDELAPRLVHGSYR